MNAGGSGGSGSGVVGGMNLSTPQASNGMGLGMPQTSQLSGMQNAYGAMSGNGNYQMAPNAWQQWLQQVQQPQQQQKSGSLMGAGKDAGSIMGLLGLL